MSNYNVNSVLQFGRLVEFGQGIATEISALKTASDSAIKSVSVANNTVSFFTSSDGTGTAAFSFNFPNELVLDQLQTQFVGNFAFNATTYAGATDPSLDGKPVLVIAVKDTNAAGTVTRTYSFLDMTTLVDVYTAGDNSITINGYNVSVKVSSVANNAIEVKSDGLHVDISGKADKVDRATAAAAHNPYDETTEAAAYASFNSNYALTGHIATLDVNGNLADSGVTFATSADVTELIGELFPDESDPE